MNKFTETEQKELNTLPILVLDNQIMLRNWYPVYINDGRIVGCENAETPGGATPRESR